MPRTPRKDESRADTADTLEQLVSLIARIGERHNPGGGLAPIPTPPRQHLLPDAPAPRTPGTVRSARVKFLGPTVPCGLDAVWVPPGSPVVLHDIVLPDGMVYVGQMESANRRGKEPGLLNPGLRTNGAGSTFVPAYYWSSYAEWSPPIRRAYLNWLASGRKAPDAPDAFIALFFSGLERRLLDSESPVPPDERAALRQEMQRLQAAYPNLDIDDKINSLWMYLDLRASATPETVYLDLARLRRVPRQYGDLDPLLELALWHFARRKEVVPGPYAYQWLVHDSDYSPRTAATRCPDEMERLFLETFAEAFPKGVRPGLRKAFIAPLYRPLNHGFTGVPLPSPLPGETPHCVARAALRKLRDHADQCADLLGSFSRYVGKYGDAARNSIAAVSLLPPVLRANHPALASFQSGVRQLLTEFAIASGDDALPGLQLAQVPAHRLVALYTGDAETRTLTRAPLVALLDALDGIGVAAEPDARRGGVWDTQTIVALASTGSEALPSLGTDSEDAPLLRAVMTLFALAGLVKTTTDALGRIVSPSLAFASREGRVASVARCVAFAVHLATTDARLPRRTAFAGLSETDRALLEKLLTGLLVARAQQARFTTATLAEVSKYYDVIGSSPETTASLLHAVQTDDPRDWVLSGQRRSSLSGDKEPRSATTDVLVSAPGVVLDVERLKAKFAESQQISALLHTIFSDEAGSADMGDQGALAHNDAAPDDKVVDSSPVEDSVTSGPLTPPQTAYLLQIVARDEWSADAADAVARSLGMLPLAAREAINDAAFELSGEALIEGDDVLTVNQYALDEWKEVYGLPA